MSGDPGWVKHDTGAAASTRTDPATAETSEPTSLGTLLGGRVSYAQFQNGYRTGLEPVLMAAAVPARTGQRVLEAGCGAGAGLLCLAARVPGLGGVGIERDTPTAMLGRSNLEANGLDWPILNVAVQDAPRPEQPFDHAFANPPWHRDRATASTRQRRDLARRAPTGMLAEWTGALSRQMRRGGTLTLVLPAALHAEAAAALLAARFGTIRLLPLWSRAGRPARIVLIQAVLGGRGDAAVLPGLVLHGVAGFTAEAEAILRHGAPLSIG